MPTRYVIEEDASIYREEVSRVAVALNASALQSLAAASPVPLGRVFRHQDQPVRLVAQGSAPYLLLDLPLLTLRAPYRLLDGVLVPQFDSTVDPIMSMEWEPPDDMWLRFVLELDCGKDTSSFARAFLFAVHENKSCWRLPIANLHDDGHLCLGEFRVTAHDYLGILEQVLAQFANSTWNRDLMHAPTVTQQMFRWKPLPDGFEVLPPQADWTSLCQKIATEITAIAIL